MSDGSANMTNENNNQQIRISLRVAEGSRVIKRAELADKLTNARKIRLEGDITGEGMFDGSEDMLIYTEANDAILTDRDALSDEDIDEIIRNIDRLIDP